MKLDRRFPDGWQDIDEYGQLEYKYALIKTTMDCLVTVNIEREGDSEYMMIERDADGNFMQQIFLENVKEFYLIIEK